MLQLHLSNRIETLAECLLDRIQTPPDSVFAAEHIIVPSTGIRRWLEWRIAQRFGVCANIEFGFPAAWIWRRIAILTGAPAERSPFCAEVLTWRLFDWFEHSAASRHRRLREYLESADATMRFELAGRAASVLERLVAYRGDWLRAWSERRRALPDTASELETEDEAWLADAWRWVLAASQASEEHPSEAMFRALTAAYHAGALPGALPPRVHFFGLPALAPLYMDIVARLSEWIDVQFYLLDPCREYWFDVVAEKQLARLAARGRAQHSESGHRLLAAWGRQTQAWLELALERTDGDFEDRFTEIEGQSLLRRLQRSILELKDLAPGTLALESVDDSIRIHLCHSMTRELEVLHDQLLGRLHDDPSLGPGEVLVAVPDIEQAAPLIDAVFGSAPAERRIPYSITGRRTVGAFPLIRAFLDLLELPETRCEATRLHDLLRVPALARAFDLDEDAIETIHRWMIETGVRWGIDGDHRARLGVPGGDRHTLAAGLRSLFFGYAFPADQPVESLDVLPYPDLEGRATLDLGGLWRFARELGALRSRLAGRRTMAEWNAALVAVLDTFFDPSEQERVQVGQVRDALAESVTRAAEGGCTDRRIEFAVAKTALEQCLLDRAPGGVPSGGVTFSGMTPLRGLPYRLICCLGLNHEAFPATPPQLEFDLMARFPRRGDRQHRLDERNVFLDLLLAARDGFYVSYTGRSARDNAPLPPSVVVSDLIDYLVRALRAPSDASTARAALIDALVTEHPLQPFSTRYFDGQDARLFSFDGALCEALGGSSAREARSGLRSEVIGVGRRNRERARAGPFIDRPLDPPSEASGNVALDDLARFLKQPVEFLLTRRLGMRLRAETALLTDEEPFALDLDGESRLGRLALALIERGLSREEIVLQLERHPDAPPGALGRLDAETLLESALPYADKLRRARRHPAVPPVSFELATPSGTLIGTLDALSGAGMLRARFGRSGARDLIDCWVRHLALCATAPQAVATRTQFLGSTEAFHFGPICDARARLADLLALYREGLRRPVRFFLRSGMAFASNGSLDRARRRWNGGFSDARPEKDDPYYRLAFGEEIDHAIDEEFEDTSRRVLGPLADSFAGGVHESFA